MKKRPRSCLKSQLDVEETVTQFKTGKTVKDIADSLRVTTKSVKRALISAGALEYHHPKEEAVLKLYNKGLILIDIAVKLTISPEQVRLVLRAHHAERGVS